MQVIHRNFTKNPLTTEEIRAMAERDRRGKPERDRKIRQLMELIDKQRKNPRKDGTVYRHFLAPFCG